MNITNYGSITIDSLISKGGIKLAYLLKQDIIDSTSLGYIFKLYNRIYNQIDNLYYGLLNGKVMDETGVVRLSNAKDEIEIFFKNMFRDDILNSILIADSNRGKYAVFRNLDNEKIRKIFPLLITFFDFFNKDDVIKTRNKIEEVSNIKNTNDWILSELNKLRHSDNSIQRHRYIRYIGSKFDIIKNDD